MKVKYTEIGAPGVSIKGVINSTKSIKVMADLTGDIECDATVVIESEAAIEGDVKATKVEILNGEITGDVIADSVIVAKLGCVKGNIFCKQLTIDEGGRLLGSCHMNHEDDSPEVE